MKCAMCGIQIDLVDEAIEQRWTPSFYDGEIQHAPACPSCTDSFLQIDMHGEWEVKKKFRGKLTYTDEEPKKHWVIGIAISEVPSQRH